MDEEKRILLLTRQALKMTRPYAFAGVFFRNLQRFDEYKEEGLTFTKEDKPLTQIYAGLTILSKEIYENETSKPSEAFKNALQKAIATDKKKYGVTAFPYNNKNFPYPVELEKINNVIEKIRYQPSPNLKFLEDGSIRHEWTVKIAKRILMNLMENIGSVCIVFENVRLTVRDFLCGRSGIYQKLKEDGDEAELIKTLATYLLPVVGLASASAAPFIVLISVILVKSYLKSYCNIG